jgi:hypothetical protein
LSESGPDQANARAWYDLPVDPFLSELAGTRRFEIRRQLGFGSFGVVYEALDRERDAIVALKTLHVPDPGALYDFKKEFRALATSTTCSGPTRRGRPPSRTSSARPTSRRCCSSPATRSEDAHRFDLYLRAQVDLYVGDALAAWTRVTERWPALVRTHALRVQHVRIVMLWLRARTALALAAAPPATALGAGVRGGRTSSPPPFATRRSWSARARPSGTPSRSSCARAPRGSGARARGPRSPCAAPSPPSTG